MLRKLEWQIPGEPLAARYNWCQDPVPGRGPAVEKHYPSGPGPPHIEASQSHSDTQHSVRLLWASDQPVAETSTWQHSTLTRTDIHAFGGIRTHNPSQRATADPTPYGATIEIGSLLSYSSHFHTIIQSLSRCFPIQYSLCSL